MKVYTYFDLTLYNSYRVKSICKIAYFPEKEEDFIILFQKLKGQGFFVLGNGNNIILSKVYYEEPFVILNGNFNKIIVNENIIEAESGTTTLEFCETALKHSLTNAEFLFDIPSSIGGAVVMNAGT